MKVATMPTVREMRAPYTSRENMSRPKSSVPMGWENDGGRNRVFMTVVVSTNSGSPKSRVAHRGAVTARSVTNAR